MVNDHFERVFNAGLPSAVVFTRSLQLSTHWHKFALLIALALGLVPRDALTANSFIVVQSTTSTQNSGLYDAILPRFTAQTGVDVRVVAVGTGQAIKNAKNCDGDVLLVHSKSAEEQFVASGYGRKRRDVMYNDFVIVGPGADPAGLAQANDAGRALKSIKHHRALFASRGDDSGTHRAELGLWHKAGIEPRTHSGAWYRETGAGMGATLNIATGMNAYTLTDRATWLSFANKRHHQIVFAGDPSMFNQYGIIPVHPGKCPQAKTKLSQQFVDWILSADGQRAIGAYQIDGQQLFFPNAVAQ